MVQNENYWGLRFDLNQSVVEAFAFKSVPALVLRVVHDKV